MIFLVVFGFIAAIVIALNIKDNSNIEKIENYLKSQNCENIVYSKGVYKGVCHEKIIAIENGFSIDLSEDKKVFNIDEIDSVNIENLKIIINNTYNIEFKNQEEMDDFYKKLKEKID